MAEYEFTTLTCIPGMIYYKGAKLQLLDLPGIIEGAKDGKGRGRQVIAVARSCDLILIVLDAAKPALHKRLIEHELEGFGIRLNKRPPPLSYRRKDSGGISFSSAVQTTLDLATVKSVCTEYRIHNADFSLRGPCTIDDVVDVIEDSCVYIPCIYVVNKIDAISMEELELYDRLDRYCPISGALSWNIDGLLEAIWADLGLVRIYTKPKGEIPDLEDPVILKRYPPSRRTVEAFCNRIHKSIANDLKHAAVWGRSTKFDPQKCGLSHVLEDEDVVRYKNLAFPNHCCFEGCGLTKILSLSNVSFLGFFLSCSESPDTKLVSCSDFYPRLPNPIVVVCRRCHVVFKIFVWGLRFSLSNKLANNCKCIFCVHRVSSHTV